MTEYFVPTGASETELVEKRSRFLGHVWPVESDFCWSKMNICYSSN